MKWWDQMPVIQHKNLIIYFVSSYLFFWTFFNLTHFDFLDYILTIWSFDFLIPASRNYMFLNHAEPPWISDFCKMHTSPFFWVSLNSCLFILYTVIHYCFLVAALWQPTLSSHLCLSLSNKGSIHSPVQIVQIQTTLYLMLSQVQNYRSTDLQVISGLNLHLALIKFSVCLIINSLRKVSGDS